MGLRTNPKELWPATRHPDPGGSWPEPAVSVSTAMILVLSGCSNLDTTTDKR
jgi:hypothetical protein